MAISHMKPFRSSSPKKVHHASTSQVSHESHSSGETMATSRANTSLDTAPTPADSAEHLPDNTAEFEGDVKTNDKLPTAETLKKIEDFHLLDAEGKTVRFGALWQGNGNKHAERVLIIFIRHFFCGNCQEYIRTLAPSLPPSKLLTLSPPTSIVIIGCGSPSLIPMYIDATQCPYPIFADPTKELYSQLGMVKTLDLGTRPEYQRRSLGSLVWGGFVQSLLKLKGGMALQGGGYAQVGGEFIFEPVETGADSPFLSPKEISDGAASKELGAEREKAVTWCHRMRNTRDHVELPELREVLGMDGEAGDDGEIKGKHEGRWQRALLARKGTGLSTRTKGSASVSPQRKLQEDELAAGRESTASAFDRPSTDKLL